VKEHDNRSRAHSGAGVHLRGPPARRGNQARTALAGDPAGAVIGSAVGDDHLESPGERIEMIEQRG
jgi:hypothetical protein